MQSNLVFINVIDIYYLRLYDKWWR